MGKDGTEIVGIDRGVVTIPPFWVDVPSASKGIRFRTGLARAKADDEIKLAEEFRPARLATREEPSGSKILQIFVVGDHVDRNSGALQIVAPGLERGENSQELFVVRVVVDLGGVELPRVECHRVQFTVARGFLRQYCT